MKINAEINIEDSNVIISYLQKVVEKEESKRFQIKTEKLDDKHLKIIIMAEDTNIFNSLINRLIKLLITTEKINSL